MKYRIKNYTVLKNIGEVYIAYSGGDQKFYPVSVNSDRKYTVNNL